ncbi:Ger(x)C family spore germination protein [Bacillus mojavensis]|uniref:Ger(x)C family spore germination protein n=1 Tax=Bacillus mojavensis TaxID=72360 RepID=UPI002DB56141|nr:Ger(x)C family spore germination protein [Bacillus mojavensis]MEC1291950.1 Ger(x)C family spore germination protein [Bacillus mojavensis]MEC1613883.1 Ger(x)C family spore germination protein [Bacillus mojavensis]MEC1623107.1 Ger(x)C family spore germination protein [Bacillus mojavensis]MEC1659987.1 Ger(x)C family spore germination protein [Bacillus mojavensis]MEC1683436.1 Ger(x)C family spore germination protein [Bacillus mojavensis]
MIRKRVLAVIMLLSIIVLPGCWDKRELTDLAIISAIGIDRTNQGNYVLHFQIINPGNVAGGLQGGGAGDRPPISVYSIVGDNMTEALRKASMKVSRRLYFAHTNLVVVSEKLAREEGLNFVLDNLDRDTEFRTTATIVIAHKTKAENIVKTLTPIDKIPSNKVNKTLDFTQAQYGRVIKTSIQDVLKTLAITTEAPVIPGYRMIGDDKKGVSLENTQATDPQAILQANGLAVFDKTGHLKYWIEDKESVGIVWLKNQIQHTFINADWGKTKDAVSLQVTHQATKLTPEIRNGRPRIHVHVTVEGIIDAVKYPFYLSDPKVLADIEKVLNKQLEKEITHAVEKIKEHKIDFIGFGDTIYRKYPKQWEKMRDTWDKEYLPDLPVDVKAETYIRRTGLRNNPLRNQLNQ